MSDEIVFPSQVVTGVSQTIAILDKHTQLIASATALGMQNVMEVIKRWADYYVPKDTLDLLHSGRIEFYGIGFNAKGRIEYGGPSAPYALWVHEDLSKHHDDPTCAKWLERAYRELAPSIDVIMKGWMTSTTTPYRDYTFANNIEA